MAPEISTTYDIPDVDELDDILNRMIDNNDTLNTGNDQIDTDSLNKPKTDSTGADLGIDKEITVTKTRQAAPKLDEARLLSSAGIPRLQRISKERLRFKGKGYEYRDIARMLNMYQLWLDDLYPRAKFADGLAMIEKLGHKKRMQMIRKDLINEGRPRRATDQDDDEGDAAALENFTMQHGEDQTGETSRTRESSAAGPDPTRNQESNVVGDGMNDDPDEDELDALLAESNDNMKGPTASTNKTASNDDDDPFADDIEAMAEMEGMW